MATLVQDSTEGAYNVAMCKAVPRVADIDLDFLALALGHGQFQDRLAEISRSAQAGFNKADLKNVRLPVPPIPDQRRVVAQCDALGEQSGTLKLLQSDTAIELDGLLPAILDRAFKGELL